MKNFLFKLALLCMTAAVFVGCNPENKNNGGTGNFNLEVKAVGPDYVELNVSAPAEVEMAYQALTEQRLFTAPVLFMTGMETGKIMTVAPGQTIRIDDLQSATDYILYAAAKVDDKNYSEVLQVKFTTEAYSYNKLLTVLDTQYDGFRMHFTLPESVKENDHVIRYTFVDQAMYNVIIDQIAFGDEHFHVLESVVMNGYRYGKYVKSDSTIRFSHLTQVLADEYGDPIPDEDGDYTDIHLPMSPNEPIVFLAGECRLGTDDEMGAIVGRYYGTPNSMTYQVPIFDWNTVDPKFDWNNTDRDSWEGSGWTGAFQKMIFKTKKPGLCDATVNIEIPKEEITVTGANIYFDMDDDVSRYIYMLLDTPGYNYIINSFLKMEGAPQEEIDEALQWFLTSYTAYQQVGVEFKSESTVLDAGKWYTEGLVGGDTYHVICTVMVDDPTIAHNPENGANQKFIHKTFEADEKTKGAPTIEIKAVNTDNPYEATFNIRVTGGPTQKITKAYWACNTPKEFAYEVNQGATYGTLLKSTEQLFTAEELEAINSEEGANCTFDILDGDVLRMVVYGCNDEFTYNVIDLENEGQGWADYEAPMAPAVDKIESPLYEALAGDWTATATIRINELAEDGETTTSRNMTYSSKVTISNDIPNLPASLSKDIYDLYPSMKDSEVDGMYEELLILADEFAESRLEGQNRMLCTGFVDFDYDHYQGVSRLQYMSPYDLFVSTFYSSYDVPQLIYDFGPKWFLQLQEDGSVVVPMDPDRLPPMSAWPGWPTYVGAYGTLPSGQGYAFYNSSDAVKGFPVEISSDYSEIKIKPIVLKDENGDETEYFMNACMVTSQYTNSVELVATVISEIVLTKGWTDSKAAAPKVSAVVPSRVKAMTIDGKAVESMPEPKICKSVTELKPVPERKFKEDENPNVVTVDMLEQAAKNIRKQFGIE